MLGNARMAHLGRARSIDDCGAWCDRCLLDCNADLFRCCSHIFSSRSSLLGSLLCIDLHNTPLLTHRQLIAGHPTSRSTPMPVFTQPLSRTASRIRSHGLIRRDWGSEVKDRLGVWIIVVPIIIGVLLILAIVLCIWRRSRNR